MFSSGLSSGLFKSKLNGKATISSNLRARLNPCWSVPNRRLCLSFVMLYR